MQRYPRRAPGLASWRAWLDASTQRTSLKTWTRGEGGAAGERPAVGSPPPKDPQWQDFRERIGDRLDVPVIFMGDPTTEFTWYFLDLDRIGDRIDVASASGCLEQLRREAHSVTQEVERLKAWAKAQGATIEFAAGGSFLISSAHPIDWSQCGTSTDNWSFSVGAGSDAHTAHAALAIAKRRGRGKVVQLSDHLARLASERALE